MIFCGEHELSLDDKGRMRIPNKLRMQLHDMDKDGFVIYAGTEGCLFIMPQNTFEERYLSRLQSAQISDTETQEAYRFLMSTIQTPVEDDQGRFVLSPKLKRVADIKKKVVFLGMMNRIEIWSKEVYEERYDPSKVNMKNIYKAIEKEDVSAHTGSL